MENQHQSSADLRFEEIDRSQNILLPVDIEELIGADHAARNIWDFVGRLKLDGFMEGVKATEGHGGRDAIHPRLLVSIWIYAITRGVHSAREIARQMKHEPGLQWLSGLRVINHHTLSDFRSRNGAGLQELFEQVLGLLHMERLITLERVTQDGTKIRAHVNKKTFSRESKIRAHLKLAQEQLEYLDRQASQEQSTRKQKAARVRAARDRSVRLEEALEEIQRLQRDKKHERDKPVQASTTDADAQFMRTSDHGLAPSLNVQLSVDGAHGFIVDVAVVKQASDSAQLLPAVERLRERFGHYPASVLADGDYTHSETVLAMAERNIDFYGSWRAGRGPGERGRRAYGRKPDYDASRFGYDPGRNEMICPEGKKLAHRAVRHPRPGATVHVFSAQPEDCRDCPARPQCCPKTPIEKHGRWASITLRAPAVEQFHHKMQTDPAKQIYRRRSQLAEFPNLWLKEKLKFRRFSGRGCLRAQAEAVLNALTFNLQRLFKIRPALAV